MHHIIYKTTNKLNGRFYIGMHSTENLNDGYLGSGKRLKAELKKYGKGNFERAVLHELPSRKLLESREREIVNEELLADPLCLNLKNGGEGGGRIWSEEHQVKFAKAGGAVSGRKNIPTMFTEEAKKKNVETRKRNGTFYTQGMRGKTHDEFARKAISSAQSGSGNSQFGSCWVTDGVKPIKIKKDKLGEYLANGYSRGRKFIPS